MAITFLSSDLSSSISWHVRQEERHTNKQTNKHDSSTYDKIMSVMCVSVHKWNCHSSWNRHSRGEYVSVSFFCYAIASREILLPAWWFSLRCQFFRLWHYRLAWAARLADTQGTKNTWKHKALLYVLRTSIIRTYVRQSCQWWSSRGYSVREIINSVWMRY